MKINWKVWRMCWMWQFLRYYWSLRTPWFQLQLSCGGADYLRQNLGYYEWWGVRAYWRHSPGWQCRDNILFSRGDESLSFTRDQRRVTLAHIGE